MTTKTNFQTIVWGISHLPELLAQAGATKVLLVVDASFPFLSIEKQVQEMPVPFVVFDQFSPNPLYEDVCKGVDCFCQHKCDAIVAVGGGSSIDVAKCIKLYCRLDPSVNYLQQECVDSGIPLIAIPTTAGTGSESTRFAVIYFEGKKQSVNHLSIIPTFALMEPEVLYTLPRYQKASTALDALCQGIESWWSVNSTAESQQLSKKAVGVLWKNIRQYVDGTGNSVDESQLAASVMKAANLAGQAINLTQTTAPHAFSYKITSLFKVPHGHAVAVCLPKIWQYMIAHPELCIDPRGKEYLMNVFDDIAQAMGCSTPQQAVEEFEAMMMSLAMPNPVSKNRADDIQLLSQSVNPVRLKNNPVQLSQEAIGSLYELIVG